MNTRGSVRITVIMRRMDEMIESKLIEEHGARFSPIFLCSFSYYIFQNTVFLQSNDIGGLTIKRRTVQSLKAAQTMKNEPYSAQKVDLVMWHVFCLARGARGLMTPLQRRPVPFSQLVLLQYRNECLSKWKMHRQISN
jgi:hypothetical protein